MSCSDRISCKEPYLPYIIYNKIIKRSSFVTTSYKTMARGRRRNINNNQRSAPVNLVASTDVVESNVHADSTIYSYNNKLIEIMLWMYDNNRRQYLSQDILGKLRRASDTDRQRRGILRLACRDVLKKSLDNLDRSDPSKSPINISSDENGGDTVLAYSVITDFFSTKEKEVSVARKAAVKFAKKLKAMARKENDDEPDVVIPRADEDGKVNILIRVEVATYDMVRSAISHLYTESGLEMPTFMSKGFSRYIKGSRRINLAAKQTLGLKIVEGKDAMSVEAYELIAKHLFHSGKTEHIFTHTFHVLDWNLMKRAENVANAHISHVFWENDHLVFHFAKSKTHQDGK